MLSGIVFLILMIPYPLIYQVILPDGSLYTIEVNPVNKQFISIKELGVSISIVYDDKILDKNYTVLRSETVSFINQSREYSYNTIHLYIRDQDNYYYDLYYDLETHILVYSIISDDKGDEYETRLMVKPYKINSSNTDSNINKSSPTTSFRTNSMKNNSSSMITTPGKTGSVNNTYTVIVLLLTIISILFILYIVWWRGWIRRK